MEPTHERVRELFRYDGKNLIRRITRGNSKKGSVAGTPQVNGYRYIQINNKLYLAHRLIWLFHYGYFPEHEIDHINRNGADNGLENLREVSHLCNSRNCEGHKDNTSGVTGISFCNAGKVWRVYIGFDNACYHLGKLKDFDEAVLLRLAAEQCLDWRSCGFASSAYRYSMKHNLISK